MRVKIGIAGILGLGLSVTVAVAQGPAQRTARLLPPVPADPTEVGGVARGTAETLPPFPESTPVARPGATPPPGQAWLNGTDSGVRTAAGTTTGSNAGMVRPLTPPVNTSKGEPSLVSRGLEKLKGTFGDDKAERSVTPPAGAANPSPQPTKEQVNAGTAFRGTAPNGQPVFAGSPAWRWNGYGAPTPGGNPFAPTGHYPAASANWLSITGATPGAFPVLVMNPLRPAPGTEPPAYVAAATPRTPPPPAFTPPVATREPAAAPRGAPPAQVVHEAPRPVVSPPPESKFPPPVMSPIEPVAPLAPYTNPPAMPPQPAPLPIPTMPALPMTLTPTAVPTLTPPPGAVGAVPPLVPAVTPVEEAPPVGPRVSAVAPLTVVQLLPATADAIVPLPPLPTLPPVAAPAGASGGPVAGVPASPRHPPPAPVPGAIPASVTEEQPRWQQNSATPVKTDWSPVGGAGKDGNWQQFNTSRERTVARGQAPDAEPNPVEKLIRQLCQGRADGVDVRWTGTKKLTLCFECRTAPEAQKLVADISGRPELTPYQIDFCVLVK